LDAAAAAAVMSRHNETALEDKRLLFMQSFVVRARDFDFGSFLFVTKN
jgi:hypothetical protein